MNIKKPFFEFQTALDNTHQFEILFQPNPFSDYYSSCNPADICAFFNIDIEEYFKAAVKYNAIIVRADKKWIKYDSARFIRKNDARLFIKEYLDHYTTAASLMR